MDSQDDAMVGAKVPSMSANETKLCPVLYRINPSTYLRKITNSFSYAAYNMANVFPPIHFTAAPTDPLAPKLNVRCDVQEPRILGTAYQTPR
jgi:hypothetical protein